MNPFCRWENWGLKGLSKFTQLQSTGASNRQVWITCFSHSILPRGHVSSLSLAPWLSPVFFPPISKLQVLGPAAIGRHTMLITKMNSKLKMQTKTGSLQATGFPGSESDYLTTLSFPLENPVLIAVHARPGVKALHILLTESPQQPNKVGCGSIPILQVSTWRLMEN